MQDSTPWHALDAMLASGEGLRTLVMHHLSSFDNFVESGIPGVISSFNPIIVSHKFDETTQKYEYIAQLQLLNPSLNRPTITEKNGATKIMTPYEARIRNMTYSGVLTVDVDVTIKELVAGEYKQSCKRFSSVAIGKVPVMVGSSYCITRVTGAQMVQNGKECRYDPGGYFVVNGAEKVVISQDRAQENHTFVYASAKTGIQHVAEVRSTNSDACSPPKATTLKYSTQSNEFGYFIRVNLHHTRADVPLFVLFRALGIETDRAILEYILTDETHADEMMNLLYGTVLDASGIYTRSAAIDSISKNISISIARDLHTSEDRIAAVERILKNELLPHVGQSYHLKALYIAHMTREILRYAIQPSLVASSRDAYLYKRVDASGALMTNIFRQHYHRMVKDSKKILVKELSAVGAFSTGGSASAINKHNVTRILKSTLLESGLRYALSTGIWSKSYGVARHGVAQVLNRMTHVATLSHLRRINTAIDQSAKLVPPRRLHATQYGVICPSETPEGGSVGVVKNMAMTATITMRSSPGPVMAVLLEMGMKPFVDHRDLGDMSSFTNVLVNGAIVGCHADSTFSLARQLRHARRQGLLHIHSGIYVTRLGIEVCTEAGRLIRPLFLVHEGKVDLATRADDKWHKWLISSDGRPRIEYLDVCEANDALIAVSVDKLMSEKGVENARYTHAELHPSLMLGVLAATIPFACRNQAPRNSYQSAMGKQAIGVPTSNQNNRFDSFAHVLMYPQKPLVATRASRYLCQDQLPSGTNAMVAIACFSGYNQEDALIINRAAVERGLFNTVFYRTYKETNARNHATGEEELFCNPVQQTARRLKPLDYTMVQENGFVPANTWVDDTCILIGKALPVKVNGQISFRDVSVSVRHGEQGYVDANTVQLDDVVGVNGDGYDFVKVRTRCPHVPALGDKFSSRHGNKGINGLNLDASDMPFTSAGMVPDAIINPHAFPSRMTCGQLMEMLLGKACLEVGCRGDGTPFQNTVSAEGLAEVFRSMGLHGYGDEVFFDGRTGEMIKCAVFFGPVQMQTLKHQTCSKVHSRGAAGPVVGLTRQPVDGRAKNGSMRCGSMESNALVAQGLSFFHSERWMRCSDEFLVNICKQCNTFAYVNAAQRIYACPSCKSTSDFSTVALPYAFKLLVQETMSLGVDVRVQTGATHC